MITNCTLLLESNNSVCIKKITDSDPNIMIVQSYAYGSPLCRTGGYNRRGSFW